jgi:NADH-quinone oxidoreductase subunit C
MMTITDVPSFLAPFEAEPRLSTDCPAYVVAPEKLLPLAESLLKEGIYNLLVDITAIDYGVEVEKRFAVVYHWYSIEQKAYLRVVSYLHHNDQPSISSIQHFFPAANWHEREVYDMFGIKFTQHPNLKRILMWEGYPYYPLRKDFPLAGIETPLPSPDTTEATGETLIPAPLMGGPFKATPGKTSATREPEAKNES